VIAGIDAGVGVDGGGEKEMEERNMWRIHRRVVVRDDPKTVNLSPHLAFHFTPVTGISWWRCVLVGISNGFEQHGTGEEGVLSNIYEI
jgi:hypothetical protein